MNWPPLILASGSPRRQLLLREAGIPFDIAPSNIDERFPSSLPPREVASFLAREKARSVARTAGALVLAADTTVILSETLFEKPPGRDEAINMLAKLSGKVHEVITGVCLISDQGESGISEVSRVKFHTLSETLIERYVDTMRPYDKAGAYGIQECMAASNNPCSEEEREFLRSIKKEELWRKVLDSTRQFPIVESLAGSFFNVMGLPLSRVYKMIQVVS